MLKNNGIWTLSLLISQKLYLQNSTHSPRSCHILLLWYVPWWIYRCVLYHCINDEYHIWTSLPWSSKCTDLLFWVHVLLYSINKGILSIYLIMQFVILLNSWYQMEVSNGSVLYLSSLRPNLKFETKCLKVTLLSKTYFFIVFYCAIPLWKINKIAIYTV